MRYTINMYDQKELLFQRSSNDLRSLTTILLDFIEMSATEVSAYIYDAKREKVVRRCSKLFNH